MTSEWDIPSAISLYNIDRWGGGYFSINASGNIQIGCGGITTLLGANGAGKTTTLRAISGLTAPRSGAIRFDGQSLVGRRARDIVAMGVVQVPEGRHLFPRMSVRENLELGAYLRRDATIRADMERVFIHFPVLAQRQAQEAGHATEEELLLLTTHGILHLLGYDHAEPEEHKEMFGLQDELLGEWRSGRGTPDPS